MSIELFRLVFFFGMHGNLVEDFNRTLHDSLKQKCLQLTFNQSYFRGPKVMSYSFGDIDTSMKIGRRCRDQREKVYRTLRWQASGDLIF